MPKIDIDMALNWRHGGEPDAAYESSSREIPILSIVDGNEISFSTTSFFFFLIRNYKKWFHKRLSEMLCVRTTLAASEKDEERMSEEETTK